MSEGGVATVDPSWTPAVRQDAERAYRVALRHRATRLNEAIRLVELGAPAGLVCQLTGIEKKSARRPYQEVHGRSSPAGQAAFTDTWYLESHRRMLDASVVWRLHQRLAEPITARLET